MLTDFAKGFSFAWSGLSALRTTGLRRFVLVPLLINIVVFSAIIGFGLYAFDGLLGRLLAYLPGWLDWLRWLLWPLFALAIFLISIYSFTILANLIAAPFNGKLSERYECLLTDQPPVGEQRALLHEVLRAPLHELRKLAYVLKLLVPLALIFLIPGLNIFAPALWLLAGAWLLALEYMDYPMDNYAIGAREQRNRLAQRRMLSLGFGTGVLLMTSIPLINFVAMPSAVLGATRMWCSDFRQSEAS